MKIKSIVPSIMIAASSLVSCGNYAPRKVQTTLNSLMVNRPIKEYMAIKSGWREGLAKDADAQHSLDSVAFRRLLDESQLKDSSIINKFNAMVKQTRLKNANSYKSSFAELDEKIKKFGISTSSHRKNLAEYEGLSVEYCSLIGKIKEPCHQDVLKLRQFKLDSLAFRNFVRQHFCTTIGAFEKTASNIKPRQIM